MKSNTAEKLIRIYSLLEKFYPINWQLRWNQTPYMPDFAQPQQIVDFVHTKGKYETVPGHVWACGLLWMQLRFVCPSLDKVANSELLYEYLLIHDLGEATSGDVSLAVKVQSSMQLGKDEERRCFVDLVSSLNNVQQQRLITVFDDFEERSGKESVEILIARWIDNLQGDHFALTYGTNLSDYSEIIGKIVKKRSAVRARNLINHLINISKSRKEPEYKLLHKKAAQEVEDVAKAHFTLIRNAGITLELADLGF